MNKYLILLLGMLTLAGCSSPDEDLQEWMQNTRQQAKAKIQKAAPPSLSAMATYTPPAMTGLNDFDPARLKVGMQGANSPNFNRPKQILENFSLESLKYVGSFQAKGKAPSAFVVADGHVYTVGLGNYMGQNYGRISAITPDSLVITELVEDTYGNWTNRRITKPLEADDSGNNGQPGAGSASNAKNQ
ncbi:pilus assembly protein PilP [Snodgrassella sp. CFCC 13594]|uniref:pilus assembly protein PilP n=1 Tax=Snodgrassella sp. CFCC 13594 TaxID=1775559 RepID=UPI0008312D70|nr:pilus assembly protein PilP [Snodgrassella sp. CFCC 13594]